VDSAPESVSEFGVNHQRMDETAILKTRPRVATLKLFTAVDSIIMHFKDFTDLLFCTATALKNLGL
jgi:hypothetical protein